MVVSVFVVVMLVAVVVVMAALAFGMMMVLVAAFVFGIIVVYHDVMFFLLAVGFPPVDIAKVPPFSCKLIAKARKLFFSREAILW